MSVRPSVFLCLIVVNITAHKPKKQWLNNMININYLILAKAQKSPLSTFAAGHLRSSTF